MNRFIFSRVAVVILSVKLIVEKGPFILNISVGMYIDTLKIISMRVI